MILNHQDPVSWISFQVSLSHQSQMQHSSLARMLHFPFFRLCFLSETLKNILIWNEKIELYKPVIHSSQSFNFLEIKYFHFKQNFFLFLHLFNLHCFRCIFYFLLNLLRPTVGVCCCEHLLLSTDPVLTPLYLTPLTHWTSLSHTRHVQHFLPIHCKSNVNRKLAETIRILNVGYIYIYQY